MMRPPDDTVDCSMDCTERTITGRGTDQDENYSRADQSAIFPSSRAGFAKHYQGRFLSNR